MANQRAKTLQKQAADDSERLAQMHQAIADTERSRNELLQQIKANAANDELMRQIRDNAPKNTKEADTMIKRSRTGPKTVAMDETGNPRICQVCGHRVYVSMSRHYVARDDTSGGLAQALSNTEPKQYDAFDCRYCGCQVIVGERKRECTVIESIEELPCEDVETESMTEAEAEAAYEREERVIREQVVASDLEAIADAKDEWTEKIMATGKTHGRRVSEQYVRGLLDAAYAYTSMRGASLDGFCRKWCEYLQEPDHSVDTAYAAARLRTRRNGYANRRKKDGDES